MNIRDAESRIEALGGTLHVRETSTDLMKVILEFPEVEVGKKRWVNYFMKNGKVSKIEAISNLITVYANDVGLISLITPNTTRRKNPA